MRGNAENATVRIPIGNLDPLIGRSPFQLAMASRSRHRSQDMGRPELPGPRWGTLRRVFPEGAAARSRPSGQGSTPRSRSVVRRRAPPRERCSAISSRWSRSCALQPAGSPRQRRRPARVAKDPAAGAGLAPRTNGVADLALRHPGRNRVTWKPRRSRRWGSWSTAWRAMRGWHPDRPWRWRSRCGTAGGTRSTSATWVPACARRWSGDGGAAERGPFRDVSRRARCPAGSADQRAARAPTPRRPISSVSRATATCTAGTRTDRDEPIAQPFEIRPADGVRPGAVNGTTLNFCDRRHLPRGGPAPG